MSYPIRNKKLDNPVGSNDVPSYDEKGARRTNTVDIPIYSQVELVSETDLSFGSILRGTAAKPLDTFEKKAALINAELDKFGMGRYQICIWFLCGFGYFLDLAWAQGVGLAATAIYLEMGVPTTSQGNIWACANAGLAVGAFSWGILVDVIGRRWAFNLTCLITSIFGLLLAAPKFNYGAICGIYFLASLGLGGNIPIDATIALEFLPQSRRNFVSLLSLWQPIGVVVACGVAYGTVAKYHCNPKAAACPTVASGQPCCTVGSNMGWRYLFIVLGCMTLAIFFLRFFVFKFQESPKFLIGRGRDEEAIQVLHNIAKFNRAAPPTLTVEMLREVEAESGPITTKDANLGAVRKVTSAFSHLKGIFGNRLQAFIWCLLAIAYMGDYWSFNLAGSYLPVVLYNYGVSNGETNVENTYREYVYIYLPGIIGAVLALFSVQLPLVGRKWSMVLSAALQGLAMAMYTQVRSTAGYVGFNAFEYIMQTYFNAVLYASAPELFDTLYRGSATGMLSCMGRLAGIVAPFAGEQYLASSSSGILWLGAGGIWLAAFMMIFLPVEMKNRQMF